MLLHKGAAIQDPILRTRSTALHKSVTLENSLFTPIPCIYIQHPSTHAHLNSNKKKHQQTCTSLSKTIFLFQLKKNVCVIVFESTFWEIGMHQVRKPKSPKQIGPLTEFSRFKEPMGPI